MTLSIVLLNFYYKNLIYLNPCLFRLKIKVSLPSVSCSEVLIPGISVCDSTWRYVANRI